MPSLTEQHQHTLLQFGAILTALRLEQRNANEMPWTYEDLSAATGIKVPTLRKMTAAGTAYGAKSVDPKHLLLLANAFGLSSSERREFYLAAQGIPQEWAVKKHNTYAHTKQMCAKMLTESRLPSVVWNQFADVVQINRYALMLYGLDEHTELQQKKHSPLANNALYQAFDPAGLLRQSMPKAAWEQFAIRNIIVFRSWSLRFRANPRYQAVKSGLWLLPDFARLWLKTVEADDHDSMQDVYKLEITHPQLGLIAFNVLITRMPTDGDTLFVGHYVPLNAATFQLFGQLQSNLPAQCVDAEEMVKKI